MQSVVDVYKLQDCILVFTKLRGYKDTHIKNEYNGIADKNLPLLSSLH